MITKNIINNNYSILENQVITLTMTCSKRLHLFSKTIKSFHDNCLDKNLIAKIIIYDDGSSIDDRFEMEKQVTFLFPKSNITFKYFNEIPTKYRHAYIMQNWYDDINTDYVFHLEDDRRINSPFYLFEMVDILKRDPEVAIVNIAQTKRDFPEDLIKKYNLKINYDKNSNYWIWPYIKSLKCGEILFYDTVRCIEGSAEYNFPYFEQFINYAGFCLQPCVMDMKKIRTIEKFRLNNSLEADFGIRYSDKYITICHNESKSTHMGVQWFNEKSAYEMNDSIR
jgi:hypothetical protein